MNASHAFLPGQKISPSTSATGDFIEKTGGTMTGPLVLAGDPVVPLGASTKKYVDDLADKITTVPPWQPLTYRPGYSGSLQARKIATAGGANPGIIELKGNVTGPAWVGPTSVADLPAGTFPAESRFLMCPSNDAPSGTSCNSISSVIILSTGLVQLNPIIIAAGAGDPSFAWVDGVYMN